MKSIVSDDLVEAERILHYAQAANDVSADDTGHNDVDDDDDGNDDYGDYPLSSKSALNAEHDTRKKSNGDQTCKSALFLRHTFDKIKKYFDSCSLIQKQYRSHYFWKKYKALVAQRHRAACAIKQTWFVYKAKQLRQTLAQQQLAEWEQLWDDSRGVLYYFNRLAMESTYFEPTTHFRPLVRDRETDALIQSWPHLDILHAGQSYDVASGAENGNYDNVLKCCICYVRRAVRFERDFDASQSSFDEGYAENGGGAEYAEQKPYCFICYNKNFAALHESTIFESSCLSIGSDDNSSEVKVDTSSAAAYNDTQSTLSNTQQAAQVQSALLYCIECNLPASRQCLCYFHDNDIKHLFSELKSNVNYRISSEATIAESLVTAQNNIRNIMNKAFEKVPHKLAPFLDVLLGNVEANKKSRKKGIVVTDEQYDKLKVLFTELRFECNDCYCDTCYMSSHSKGKRTTHKWLGFREETAVCEGCKCTPADWLCPECDENFDRAKHEQQLAAEVEKDSFYEREDDDDGALVSASKSMTKPPDDHLYAVGKKYCANCFDIYHSHGTKKLHVKHRKMLKDKIKMTDRLGHCRICHKRAASKSCPRKRCTSSPCCLFCFEFLHDGICNGVGKTT